MKLFFLLIGLYLLYLPCMPCVDGSSKQVQAGTEVSLTKEHDKHEHPGAACSPSCVCACCASSTIYQPVMQLAFTVSPYHTRSYSVYISPSIKGMSLPVWQPPQLLS